LKGGTLAVLSWLPTIYAIVFLISLALFRGSFSVARSDDGVWTLLGAIHGFVGLLTLAMIIYCTRVITKNPSISFSRKVLWISGVWLFSLVTLPLYFSLYPTSA
jgi:hypothetical protein